MFCITFAISATDLLFDIINKKARYNGINVKYWQMAFWSVPTNQYLESLVKQNQCKFKGLFLHSTSVVILPNIKNLTPESLNSAQAFGSRSVLHIDAPSKCLQPCCVFSKLGANTRQALSRVQKPLFVTTEWQIHVHYIRVFQSFCALCGLYLHTLMQQIVSIISLHT